MLPYVLAKETPLAVCNETWICIALTRSDPAKSTKWNLDTTVVHSPAPGSSSMLKLASGARRPSELAGLSPPRVEVGVPGRDGIERRLAGDAGWFANMEPGRARRDGERADVLGSGEVERGGGPDPANFFCVRVREKMACEREDWAFMSVSLVRRIAVPFRMSLGGMCVSRYIKRMEAPHGNWPA